MNDLADRDAARYRWLRRQVVLRKAALELPANVTVHLDRTFVHGMGTQYAPTRAFEERARELDKLIDEALGLPKP
jgi:hypothetical protein